jgi:hypothetical protein
VSGPAPLTDLAFEKVELAGVYVDDGAFRSGARCLREAADLLERAADQADAAMRANRP